MSNIKNKQTVYLVIRDDDNVCCAVAKTEEKAQELAGEYEQKAWDQNINIHFSVMGQTFYDE